MDTEKLNALKERAYKTAVLFPSKEYCAHANMTMAMKYGLPTSIAIMTNLPANIILLVDLWLMITRSFPTRVMKISLVKA